MRSPEQQYAAYSKHTLVSRGAVPCSVNVSLPHIAYDTITPIQSHTDTQRVHYVQLPPSKHTTHHERQHVTNTHTPN